MSNHFAKYGNTTPEISEELHRNRMPGRVQIKSREEIIADFEALFPELGSESFAVKGSIAINKVEQLLERLERYMVMIEEGDGDRVPIQDDLVPELLKVLR